MAKRFHETAIWGEDWFIALPKDYRLFWFYILDDCDHAGVWKPNVTTFNKLFDCTVSLKEALELFNLDKSRVMCLANSRWFIPQFIPFQYGTSLVKTNHMHQGILKILSENNINLPSICPQVHVTDSPKDKDKDKEIDIDKDIDIDNEVLKIWNLFANEVHLAEVKKLSTKRKSAIAARFSEKEFIFQDILQAIRRSNFLLGQNDSGWKVDFDFIFLSTNNYLKILEGKYENRNGNNGHNGNSGTGIKAPSGKYDAYK